MGLKERFEGNVDHLQVMIHEEPLPEVNMKKRYLVLYDQVPGGTGYLKQLANTPDDFILMLENALKKLNFCQCNIDPNKDGCYSCLYAYRVSHDLPNISRNEAREVISSLVSLKGKLQETKSIDGININALFDSDLERRFIEGLRRSSYNNQSVEVKNEIFNGKTGYLIKVGNYSYRVELQVDIDENDGVSVPCRADFVITPERQSTVNIHPIVVFTDGFHIEMSSYSLCQHDPLLPDDGAVRLYLDTLRYCLSGSGRLVAQIYAVDRSRGIYVFHRRADCELFHRKFFPN